MRTLILYATLLDSSVTESDDMRSAQYENDNDIGVAVIDSFTHYVLEFMEGINKTSQLSMQDLVSMTSQVDHSDLTSSP